MMPTGPKGQKRPADVIGNAVKVIRTSGARKKSPRAARCSIKQEENANKDEGQHQAD